MVSEHDLTRFYLWAEPQEIAYTVENFQKWRDYERSGDSVLSGNADSVSSRMRVGTSVLPRHGLFQLSGSEDERVGDGVEGEQSNSGEWGYSGEASAPIEDSEYPSGNEEIEEETGINLGNPLSIFGVYLRGKQESWNYFQSRFRFAETVRLTMNYSHLSKNQVGIVVASRMKYGKIQCEVYFNWNQIEWIPETILSIERK